MARPTKYSDKLASDICNKIAEDDIERIILLLTEIRDILAEEYGFSADFDLDREH